MKRQLVAALLALNVAAVAVPSATFTVSAAEAEPAVEAQATEEVEVDAQANDTTAEEIDLSQYRTVRLQEVENYAGPTGTTYAFTGAASTRRSAINSETDTKLHKSNDKAEMRDIVSKAKTEIDQLANEEDKTAVRETVEKALDVNYDANAGLFMDDGDKYFSDTLNGDVSSYYTNNEKIGLKDAKIKADNIKDIVNYYIQKVTGKLDTVADTKAKANEYPGYINDDIEKAGFKTKEALKAEYTANVKSYMPYDWKLDDYTVAHQDAIKTSRDDQVDAIEHASTEVAVRTAYTNHQTLVGTLGDASHDPKKITDLRTEKKTALEKYLPGDKKEDSYTAIQLKAINDIKAKYAPKFVNGGADRAMKRADINSSYEKAIAEIDAVIGKEQSETNLNDLMNKIKSIGKLDASNYKEKYAAIKAANDAYNKLEEGSVGKTKIENESALKTDPNANRDTTPPADGEHYTYKEVLDNAKNRYDDLTVLQLTEAYKKLSVDLTTVNTDNYQDYKAAFDNAQATEKTLFNKDRLEGDYDYDSFAQAKSQAETAYDAAKGIMIDAAANDFKDLTKGSLKHIIDDDIAITEENVGDVTKAIKAYEILAKFASTDPDKIAGNAVADECYRKDADKYAKLQKQLKTYQDKQQAAEDRVNLAKAKIALEYTSKAYTGKEIRPAVTVTNVSGEVVSSDNYTVTYNNNVNVGEVKVTVVAIGNEYKGSNDTATFKITQRSLADAKVVVENMYYRSGKARNAVPAVKVDGVDIAKNRDYTVVYKNNVSVGVAKVEITGVGNYTGKTSASYVIMPEKATIKSLKAGKKKFTVKIKQEKGAKYQVAYKVKGSSKYKTVATKNVTKTVKSLKKGKTYSVKVRAYQTINGKKYLGKYSNVKTVKVK